MQLQNKITADRSYRLQLKKPDAPAPTPLQEGLPAAHHSGEHAPAHNPAR